MTTEQKDEFRFRIVKYWASEEISKRKSYATNERYFSLNADLKDKELADARTLLKLMFQEVENHNAKIKSKLTLLNNLNYKRNWLSSNCFSGLSIPLKRIDEFVTANPEMEVYQIVKLLMG